jgi:hypothetical protein
MKIVVNNDQQGLHENLKPPILSKSYLYEKKSYKYSSLTIGQTPKILSKSSYENSNCSHTHTTKYCTKTSHENTG